MDATDALDASTKSNVELVAQVGPEQWDISTPCAESSVRNLVGHLIAGRQVYCELLKGVPAETLRPMLEQQSETVGTEPVSARESAAQSVRAAFAEPGALERTVHHRLGDMPRSELLIQLIGDCVVCSWDLATALGVDPGLDEQLVEYAYGFYASRAQCDNLCVIGWFEVATGPLPEGATPLEQLIHPVGR